MKKQLLYLSAALFFTMNSKGNNPGIISFENIQSGFIENIGQIKDQYGRPNGKVKFIYTDKFFNLELTDQGFSYEFFKANNSPDKFPESGDNHFVKDDGNENDIQSISSRRVDVILKNSNPRVQLIKEDETGVYYNYYLNCLPAPGFTYAKSFNKIIYKNIYPGIDMVFTAPNEDEPMKYEFIASPGANIKQIQISYRGANGMFINKEGDLQIETAFGNVRECDLNCYYLPDNTPVESNLILKGNTVSFEVPVLKYQTLIIDPSLVWGTYFGGENSEEVNAEIAVDKNAKSIIAGSTQSISAIATTGAHQTVYRGMTDACIAKFDQNGKIQWATYYGGQAKDLAHGIAVDKTNNIFIAGQTKSDNYIATTGAYQTVNEGSSDGFVAKFTPAGILSWGTYLGGDIDDDIKNIVCDNDANVYIGGLTASPTGIATPGAFQVTHGGDDDILLAKFSNNGTRLWATYYGGNLSDRAQGITVDRFNNLIVCGSVATTSGLASAGAFQTTYGGGISDAFLSKFDSLGHRLWGTYFGGERDDHGRTPITDSNGNIYWTGFTTSTTNIASPGAYQTEWAANNGIPANDGIAAKFNASGNRIWSTYYGGDKNDELYSAAIYSKNRICFAGSARSSTAIATSDAFQTQLFPLSQDGVLLIMDSAGHRIYATYFGGPDNDQIADVTVSKTGFVYFVVNTDSTMPCSPWVSQTNNNGVSDLGAYKFYIGPGCYDDNEPNETLADATLLTVLTDSTLYGYSGCISRSSDEDWFKFKVVSPMVNFKIQLVDLNVDYDLQLLNSNGGVLQTSHNVGTASESIIFNNATKKKYNLHIVHSSSEHDSLHCYRLLVYKSTTPFRIESGESSNFGEDGLLISPNPASNFVHLTFNSKSGGSADIVVYDLMMREVIHKNFMVGEGKINTDIMLPQVPSGPYIIEVRKENQVLRKKIMIQN